ncbi:MAG: magnesium transporter [Actinobacteria bacterium]|nr:magnesium transporter [Actinomycetota bacterium]MBV8479411.1 magnesium transporter [Actinomycetota bacterium]
MQATAIPTPRLVHLSLVTGGALLDPADAKLGRVDDLIVRLGDDEYPPVTGLLATLAGRQVFVPADAIQEIDHGRVKLRVRQLDLQPFERREREVLLKKDVLDRQLINVDGARLVRANEIELARLDGWYRVVGVDIGVRGLVRRVVPRSLASSVGTSGFLDWSSVEPFTGHVPTVRLRVPHPKLARLHPAQLADLVEQASHDEGEEILDSLDSDPELEADVFEELEPGHQQEFMEDKPDTEIAEILALMESDDAADLVNQLPEERREEVVRLLPLVQRRRVRALLGYDPATAGGLMSPEFVCVFSQAKQAEVLDRIRATQTSAEALAWIYVMNASQRLTGAVALVDLLRAGPDACVGDVADAPQQVRPDADLEEIARLMTDFDLTVVPVVDADSRLLGVVTVDDVLELVLPRGWRRQFGLFGE